MMDVSRLSLIGRLVMALLAVFAFGAIVATAAQAATEGPFWTVEGTSGKQEKLNTNETREITIKAVGSITLEAELLTVKAKVICPTARVSKGSYLAGGVPGTSREVAEFTGEPGRKCTVINNGSNCSVEEPIRTEPIRNELVVSDGPPAGTFGPYILIEFKTESTSNFVVLKFTGTCTVATTEVKGEVLGSVFTDPAVNSGTEEQITTGNEGTKSFTSYYLRFPDIAKSIWLWTGSVFKLTEPAPLEAFGNKATLTGTILVLLGNGKKYGSEL
jgi:hypothetical protein